MEEFGRYQLVKVLARGGMGEVHLARQAGMQGFEKLVVIKRILPHLASDDEFIHMFLDEARIAAKLNHPNIVQIFDLGQEGEYYYLTMEYIHGEDVRRLSRKAAAKQRSIPPALACRIVADSAAGLDFAHKKHDEQGRPLHIVHRDIAPHNILVTFDGGVKVIDFGIARAAGRLTHTATGAIKGRFEYMSPEHAGGLEVDHRSDIFALGVVLHEVLTGKRLFKRDNEVQTLIAVNECRVPPPSTLNPAVPPELDAVVLKALARDRDERYVDAQAFRLALEDWIVHARQSASSAHLAAFMTDVYADRLEIEAKLGHPLLEELSPTGSKPTLDKVPAGGGEKTITRPRAAEPTPSAPSAPTPTGTQTAPAAAAAADAGRTAARWALPATIGSLAVGVALLAFVLRAAPTPPAPTPAPPPPVAAIPTPAPAPAPAVVAAVAPPVEIKLQVHSDPDGAEVHLGPVLLGHTPLSTVMPRSNQAVLLDLRLRHHKSQTLEIVPTENQSVSLTLPKLEVRAAPPPVEKPLDIKLGR